MFSVNISFRVATGLRRLKHITGNCTFGTPDLSSWLYMQFFHAESKSAVSIEQFLHPGWKVENKTYLLEPRFLIVRFPMICFHRTEGYIELCRVLTVGNSIETDSLLPGGVGHPAFLFNFSNK